jgi:hypothetical protein
MAVSLIKMKIIAKTLFSLLGLLIAFYVFTVFRDFYSNSMLVGSYNIPTQKGLLFLLEELWSAVIVLAILIGSLVQKPWAWHLLLFITIYSILITIASILFSAEDKLMDCLKLVFYFGLIALAASKLISGYYNIELKKQSFYMASIAAVIVFAFYLQ